VQPAAEQYLVTTLSLAETDKEQTQDFNNTRLVRPEVGTGENCILRVNYKSRCSSVGIATGYGLDERRSEVRVPVG
jgi:hypothetical protein